MLRSLQLPRGVALDGTPGARAWVVALAIAVLQVSAVAWGLAILR